MGRFNFGFCESKGLSGRKWARRASEALRRPLVVMMVGLVVRVAMRAVDVRIGALTLRLR